MLVKVIKMFSKEEREEKRKYGQERQRNLSENEKQKFVQYRKKCYKMLKSVSWLLLIYR